jgi:hypothetical protein
MRIIKLSISAIFTFSLVFWAGCTKDFSNVVEESSPVYSINYIKPLPDTALTQKDTLSLEVGFSSTNKPASVRVEFVTSSQVEISATLAQTSSTSNFFGKAVAGSTVPSGQYEVNYFVSNDDGSTTTLGKQNIIIRKWDNSAPVIDSIYAADSVSVSEPDTVFILLKAEVSDADGKSDIQSVSYYAVKPSGSKGETFYLYDDGVIDGSHYDQVAGDQIYTNKISIPYSVTKGTYRFDFQAKDKSGTVSAIKSHYITIK